MIQIVHGNLLDSSATFICHQVNCRGVMGSGVARQIRERWPCVYDSYLKLCKSVTEPGHLLGCASVVDVGDGRYVCNLFGQLDYGSDGKAYTRIGELRKCCQYIADAARPGDTIAMPYRIGCGLGGGDWGATMDMLADVFKDHHLTLYKMM